MARKDKLISLVIPVHNEAESLEWFFDDLNQSVKRSSSDYSFEYIFVDDGSTDESLNKIKRIVQKNDDAHFLSFSRNFGKEAATSAGLQAAHGDAVIMIDADGQHPSEIIVQLLERWEEGAEVVIGIRSSNQSEGFVKKYGSKLFYWILSRLNEKGVTPSATDFRLVDRRVVSQFNRLTEHNRITRGLLDWLGFRRSYVEFDAPARKYGRATYSHSKLLRLALNSFVSHSTKPLKMIGALGLLVTLLSAITGLFILVEEWLLSDPMNLNITGTALLAVFLSFLTGIILVSIGLLALYIETIHSETQNRPLFIVADTDLKDRQLI
jgi:polyisoprenyl-phosphate glycosyltransferase